MTTNNIDIITGVIVAKNIFEIKITHCQRVSLVRLCVRCTYSVYISVNEFKKPNQTSLYSYKSPWRFLCVRHTDQTKKKKRLKCHEKAVHQGKKEIYIININR